MTQRQRESAAKYCYDLSKVVMTIAGIANLFSGRFDLVNFLLGLVGGIGLYVVGFLLDGMEAPP